MGKNESRRKRLLLILAGFMSQQHANVSQAGICSDNYCTCCHTEIEVVILLIQSQYINNGPTSPSADPINVSRLEGQPLECPWLCHGSDLKGIQSLTLSLSRGTWSSRRSTKERQVDRQSVKEAKGTKTHPHPSIYKQTKQNKRTNRQAKRLQNHTSQANGIEETSVMRLMGFNLSRRDGPV